MNNKKTKKAKNISKHSLAKQTMCLQWCTVQFKSNRLLRGEKIYSFRFSDLKKKPKKTYINHIMPEPNFSCHSSITFGFRMRHETNRKLLTLQAHLPNIYTHAATPAPCASRHIWMQGTGGTTQIPKAFTRNSHRLLFLKLVYTEGTYGSLKIVQ